MLQTATQSTLLLTVLYSRHMSSLQSYVRDAKHFLQTSSMPVRTHQPDKQLHLGTITNAYCAPCSNGMPSSIQWSLSSSPSWKSMPSFNFTEFQERHGIAMPDMFKREEKPRPGLLLRQQGYKPKHPIIIVPRVCHQWAGAMGRQRMRIQFLQVLCYPELQCS